MATMSIGAAILGVALLFSWKDFELGGALRALFASPEGRRYFWASLALTLALAIGLGVQAVWPIVILEPQELGFARMMAKSFYLFWPLLLAAALARISESSREKVLMSWLVTLAVMGAIGVAQHFTGWPRPQVIPEHPTRFHATLFLGHHLSVASILIFPFFVALDRWMRSVGSVRERLFLAATILLGGATLLLGYSRTLWIALPAGIFVWAMIAASKRARWAAVAAFLLLGLIASQSPIIQKRITTGINLTERERLWEANVELFKMRPLTGTGFNQNHQLGGAYVQQQYPSEQVFWGHAHNNLLHMLGGTGILGLAAWLYWCALAFLMTWKTSNAFGIGRGLFCAWIVLHLNGLTQVNVWEGKVEHQMAWALAWALAGLIAANNARGKEAA